MQMKGIRHEGYSSEASEILIKASPITAEMLDTTAQTVMQFDADDTILDVILLPEAAVATPGATFNIGLNAGFTGGPAEGDALFNGAAVDALTPTRLSYLAPSATNTLRGCSATGGAITVTSAGDYTLSDWQGELIVLYVKR